VEGADHAALDRLNALSMRFVVVSPRAYSLWLCFEIS
jgi:hypothetical protein